MASQLNTAVNAVVTTAYFYVISYTNALLREEEDFDHFDVSTSPARKNLSKEVILEGWAGTTNDVSCTAHGRFDTLEAAREHVLSILGDDYREDRLNRGLDDDIVDDSVVARFRVGALPAMGENWSREFAKETIREVGVDTTDAEIETKIAELEQVAIRECEQTMDSAAVRQAMHDRREEEREEAAEEDEDDYEGRCDSLAGAELDRDYD